MKCDIEELIEYFKTDKDRPSITGKNLDEEIKELWTKREALYNECAEYSFTSSHKKDFDEEIEKFAEYIVKIFNQ